MSTVFYVSAKTSAGPGKVQVTFTEYVADQAPDQQPTPMPMFGAQGPSVFTRILDQADADQFEINSLWQQTLEPYSVKK